MMEPLLDRLLLDAEARAVRREPREALLLLRWAATIASRAMMPRVLLAFHRVRALHATSDQHPSVPSAPAPVESDRLGFPVPRFASRPPELDRTAFVPAPRFTRGTRIDARVESTTVSRAQGRRGIPAVLSRCSKVLHPSRGGVLYRKSAWGEEIDRRSRPRNSTGLLVTCLAICLVGTVGAGALFLQVRPAEGWDGAATEAAAVALRLGNARETVAILNRLPDLDSRALLVRGRALLSLADTQAAVLSFQKSVAHPGATPEAIFSGARELAMLPCCASMAAEAYLLAFERGIANDRFSEIAQHLDQSGRPDQARRIRELGNTSR